MIAAGLSFLNFFYGLFILPESLPKDQRRSFDWKRANPVGSVVRLRRYPQILSLIISMMLIYIAGHAAQSTWTYYTMLKFNWSVRWVSYSLAFVGLSIAAVQGGLVRLIIPKIGQRNAVYAGLGLYIVGFLLFAFATKGWMMFAFLIPYALAGISGPAMQGIMSSQVSASEQGELQGALTSLVSLTSILGPLLMTGLFHHFTDKNTPVYFPGAPFAMGAVLTGVSLILAIRSFSLHRNT
nr:Major Facilitator Superfamily [uncultured bacterium]